MSVRIGAAAWAIPRAAAGAFPEAGSVLQRYAGVFDAVEINSTFYRAHRRSTFERWADSVPPQFRFAVKVPKAVTHEARLSGCEERIAVFVEEIGGLGGKLGPVLLQLPPSFAFDAALLDAVHPRLTDGGRLDLVCEPRHASWFTPEVEAWLADRRVARVAADPARHPGAGAPGGWPGLAYHRLHGSPRIYYSPYPQAALAGIAETLRLSPARQTWCIFDNTALGAATVDALTVRARLGASGETGA